MLSNWSMYWLASSLCEDISNGSKWKNICFYYTSLQINHLQINHLLLHSWFALTPPFKYIYMITWLHASSESPSWLWSDPQCASLCSLHHSLYIWIIKSYKFILLHAQALPWGASPTSLNHHLQMHLQVHLITFSEFTHSLHPSPSLRSLPCHLPVLTW